MTDSESAGYFNDSRKVEHGKYFLGTDSALSDIFENRKPQSLWWAEKNLIKTIGNLVQKYYNNGHIFIYFTFRWFYFLSQYLKFPSFVFQVWTNRVYFDHEDISQSLASETLTEKISKVLCENFPSNQAERGIAAELAGGVIWF